MDEINDLIPLYNSEHYFVQSNHLIEARNKQPLTFLEKLIFAKMCTMIDPQDTDFIEYTIYIRDIIDILGITDSGRAYQNIIEAARKLKTRDITIIVKDKESGREEILDTNLVIGVKRAKKAKEERDMYVKLAFHPDLKPYLLRLKSNFTLLDIRNFVSLHSGSTMRIYELLKQYENTHTKQREIPLEVLKSMLGVVDKYPLYGNFKQKILDEAQRRINESTDITFTYEEIKKGKKVSAIRFKIIKKAKTKPGTTKEPLDLLSSSTLMVNDNQQEFFDEIYDVVKSWGITAGTLLKLLDEYNIERIRTALKITQRQVKQGKIKENIAGFFVKALKEEYIDTVERAIQEREKRREAALIKRQYEESKEQKAIKRKDELVKFQTQLAMELVSKDAMLIQKAIDKMHTSLVGRAVHNTTLSFEENLASPLFVSAFVSAIMSICPDPFDKFKAE